MVARQQLSEIKKLNRGLYNAEDSETLSSGYASASRNAVPLRLGGIKKRGGTKKLLASQNANKIVNLPYFEDRTGNKNELVIDNSGKFYKRDGSTLTNYSTQVILKAAARYGTAMFYKGIYDYLLIGNINDYTKKIKYTPDGTWSELAAEVTATGDVRGIVYVSDTEIYAYMYGEAIYKWNGSAWSSYCPLIESLTINKYFYLDGTDYIYAATSGGVYYFNNANNFWIRLGDMTDNVFDVYAVSISSVYSVISTKIRKFTTSWVDVQTGLAVATDYGIYYFNNNFIVLLKHTQTIYISPNGTSWSIGTVACDDGNAITDIQDCSFDGVNYLFIGFRRFYQGGPPLYSYTVAIAYTMDLTNWTTKVGYTYGANEFFDFSLNLTYGNGNYNILMINIGYSGSIYHTTSLSSAWTGIIVTGTSAKELKFSNGNFWFIDYGTANIYFSTTGTAWNTATCGLSVVHDVSFINSEFQAIGLDTTLKREHSGDGNTWKNEFIQYIYISNTESYGCDNSGVYYFNGTVWSTLGSLANIKYLSYASSTEIYAATSAGLYVWNGSAWALHQNIIGSNDIRSVVYVNPTQIYAAVYGSGVYIYDGASWRQLGGDCGNNNIQCLSVGTTILAGANADGVFQKLNTIFGTENLGDRLPTETIPKKFTGTCAGGTTITLSSGNTDDIYLGAWIKHASMPDFLYVTGITNSTDFTASVALAADTYTDFEVIYAPRAKFIEIYNNMVWLAHIHYAGRTEASQVAISNIGDFDDWRDIDMVTAGENGTRIIQFGTGEADVINGIKGVNGRLVVFKGRSTYSVLCTAPTADSTSSQKIADVGCIAPGSIQVINTQRGDLIVFLSAFGFYACDGSNVFPIGQAIDYDFNPNMYDEITSVYDRALRQYRVCIPSTPTSTECDLTLTLDIDAMGWWESDVKSTAQNVWDSETYIAYDKNILHESLEYAKDNIVYDDSGGTDILLSHTLPINLPNQMVQKELRELYCQFDGVTTIDVYLYEDGTLMQTLTNVSQDTKYMVSVKGKNFAVKIEQTTEDDTFQFYGLTFKYKLLTER